MLELFEQFPQMIGLDVPGFSSWLHYACARGTLPVVKALVSKGFDPDARDGEGVPPLTYAAYYGQEDIARFLLDLGAPFDVSASVRNPLFASIIAGSPATARLLLDRGIDTRTRYDSASMKNMDAVAFAVMREEPEIARMIALANSAGDEAAAERSLAEAREVAEKNIIRR
jgi:ankyrin repeat protein